jgi:hypothetical protein
MRSKVLIVFTILFVLCIEKTFAQVWENASNNESTPPVEPDIRLFHEDDFSKLSWLKEFTNIIVINKANEGSDKQTLKLFVNGKLMMVTKVSTGREKYEAGCAPGQDPKTNHCSARAYWSTTPVGYFDVDKLVENYFSNLWQTWMPYSVFFESGIATHQAPAGTEGKLGGRASGGCVRMHPNMAPVLFKTVLTTEKGLIPQIDRQGNLKKTKAGDTIRAIGYKTLVIVQNEIVK